MLCMMVFYCQVRTMGNCMGDVAGALIVSGSEGLLDHNVYNGKTAATGRTTRL